MLGIASGLHPPIDSLLTRLIREFFDGCSPVSIWAADLRSGRILVLVSADKIIADLAMNGLEMRILSTIAKFAINLLKSNSIAAMLRKS